MPNIELERAGREALADVTAIYRELCILEQSGVVPLVFRGLLERMEHAAMSLGAISADLLGQSE